MLFKGETDIAREAELFSFSGKAAVTPAISMNASEATVIAEPKVDPELLRLQSENAELLSQITRMREDWRSELSKAREAAQAEAAAQHIRNDERNVALLAQALDEAKSDFHVGLADLRSTAVTLAAATIRRLVDLRDNDAQWLADAIKRRLSELEGQVAVGIALPQALRSDVGRMELPSELQLEFDHTLEPGAARIDLRLGAIPIRTRDGLIRLLEFLEGDHA